MAYNNGDDKEKMSRREFKLEKLKIKSEAKKARAENPRSTNINISTPMGNFGVNRGPQTPSRPSEEEMEPSAKPKEEKPISSAKVKAAVMAAMGKKKKGMS